MGLPAGLFEIAKHFFRKKWVNIKTIIPYSLLAILCRLSYLFFQFQQLLKGFFIGFFGLLMRRL